MGPSTNQRSDAGAGVATSPSAAASGCGSSSASAAPLFSLMVMPNRRDAMASSEGTWPTMTTVSSDVVEICARMASTFWS